MNLTDTQKKKIFGDYNLEILRYLKKYYKNVTFPYQDDANDDYEYYYKTVELRQAAYLVSHFKNYEKLLPKKLIEDFYYLMDLYRQTEIYQDVVFNESVSNLIEFGHF